MAARVRSPISFSSPWSPTPSSVLSDSVMDAQPTGDLGRRPSFDIDVASVTTSKFSRFLQAFHRLFHTMYLLLGGTPPPPDLRRATVVAAHTRNLSPSRNPDAPVRHAIIDRPTAATSDMVHTEAASQPCRLQGLERSAWEGSCSVRSVRTVQRWICFRVSARNAQLFLVPPSPQPSHSRIPNHSPQQ